MASDQHRELSYATRRQERFGAKARPSCVMSLANSPSQRIGRGVAVDASERDNKVQISCMRPHRWSQRVRAQLIKQFTHPVGHLC